MDSRSIRRGRKIRSQQVYKTGYPSEPNEKLRNPHSFSQYLPNRSMPRAVRMFIGKM